MTLDESWPKSHQSGAVDTDLPNERSKLIGLYVTTNTKNTRSEVADKLLVLAAKSMFIRYYRWFRKCAYIDDFPAAIDY